MMKLVSLLSGLLLHSGLFAAELLANRPAMRKIMAVEFELRDVSPIPNVTQEVERTALIDSVIKKTLTEKGYNIVPA
jgi:hypothetical protein